MSTVLNLGLSNQNQRDSPETAGYCYDLNETLPKDGAEITNDTVTQTLMNAIIEENAHGFNDTLTLVPKQVLIAIAKENQARHLTSGAFIKKNALPAPRKRR